MFITIIAASIIIIITMGFPEVVLSDFARLEAETSTAEDQAQSYIIVEKFIA